MIGGRDRHARYLNMTGDAYLELEETKEKWAKAMAHPNFKRVFADYCEYEWYVDYFRMMNNPPKRRVGISGKQAMEERRQAQLDDWEQREKELDELELSEQAKEGQGL